ncbi:spore germination protein [Natranaerobius thermophilus]|uniref:GerA spore germination protein n=1 Tax=Natranaerobius thermophilus (strain ATCC BAA-1301 / DSM 18059 / JW/NM-WN-LF) TaxID=457570 RepID=B2A180_NATTJ|nr:spore germination protein [Natranaerobius thermophilus]ACB86021.1 GerA spore germination protein [Natranaerobius thermophilus JW/NM-WN-LF]
MLNIIQKLIKKKRPYIMSTEKLDDSNNTKISKNFNYNHKHLKNIFENSDDICFRNFITDSNANVLTLFIEGLVNEELVNSDIIKPLQYNSTKEKNTDEASPETIKKRLFTVGTEVQTKTCFNQLIEEVLDGKTAIIIEGLPQGFIIDLTQWENRGIEEPINEQSIKGPREGFTETLRINTSQLRRRIKSHHFKIQQFRIGKQTNTNIAVAYCENIANQTIVNEVINRINKIDIDGILESNYIHELIEERTITIFPEMIDTERPDKVAGHLLEGKIAILTDGTPFAIILPVTLSEFFHTPEDYYTRYIFSFVQRTLRFASFFIATCLPSIYVLMTKFHYEMIPVDIIFSIAEAREAVPFPPLLEVLLIEVIVEFLREASLRLPGPIGQTVGIVGALVIGDAAVNAELMSPVLVIFTAFSMISSFVIPNYSMASALRLLRFPILFMTGILGGFGFMIAWFLIATHLCNISSFGVPFLQPIAPFKLSEQRDTVYRMPFRWVRKRPKAVANKNIRRQKGVEEED